MKSIHLWLRGFVSIILNLFLRVFAISTFLKFIHAPKNPKKGYPENNLPTYIFFISLPSGLPMDILNAPMSRVTCPNVENPENQLINFVIFTLNAQNWTAWFSGFSTFKKTQMAKTLRNGLSMCHFWSVAKVAPGFWCAKESKNLER